MTRNGGDLNTTCVKKMLYVGVQISPIWESSLEVTYRTEVDF